MIKTLIKPKKTLLILFFGLYTGVSYSQFVLSPEEQFAEGEEFILSEEYDEALPYFRQLYEKGYKTANICYKIGYCYLFIHGKKENAVEFLERAVKKVSRQYIGKLPDEDNAPLDALLYLGIAYRINYQFEKCESTLSVLKDSLKTDSELFRQADFELQLCENARELIKAEIILKKTPLNQNINTTYSNYNPLVNSDETLIYYMNALKFYDAIMKSVKTSENWTVADNLTPAVRSDGDFLITGMSDDGNALLLQMYDPYTRGDIYISENNNGNWEKIKKLNSNINTQYNETHASFAHDGRSVYFTSSRPGGHGGLDIYRSDKTSEGDWGPAVNLGHTVNSALNEDTPFITKDGKILWFSSQGHYNMGGYDIFMSEQDDEGNWTNPSNVGYPLNTTDDDLFYFPLKDGTIGYHAKYADNIFGSMDIFRFELLSKANPARFTLHGLLKLSDNTPLPYERIELAMVDILKKDTLSTQRAEKDGRYNYRLPSGEYELNFFADKKYLDKKTISLPEYLTVNELIINTELDEKLLADIDQMKDKKPDELVRVTEKPALQPADTFNIRHILFGFDRFVITASDLSYLSDLITLLKKYPQVEIGINGYTDAIGDASYNKLLSVKRAAQIRDMMLSGNIGKTRITLTGYGEEFPAALNNQPDGSDNPEGRKYNRRVEIVLDKVPENLIIIRQQNIPAEYLVKKK